MPLTLDQQRRARAQDEGLPPDVAAEVLIAFERWIKRRTTKDLAEELGVAVLAGGKSCFTTFARDDRNADIFELSKELSRGLPIDEAEIIKVLCSEFKRFRRRALSQVRASTRASDRLLVKIFNSESSCGPVPESKKQLERILRSVSRCRDSKI
jgi:hypothetical protein